MMEEDKTLMDLDRRFGELVRKPYKSSAEIEEMEMVRNALEAALQKEEQPLLDDLREKGTSLKSIWDLVNTVYSYEEAIPVLVKHLSEPYHRRNKEAIVRALAVKEAKGIASEAIIGEYERTPKDESAFRWTFGNTMRVVATEKDFDSLERIVLDESNGDSRQMFVVALAKLKTPRVNEVLNQLLTDECKIVATEAEKAVRRRARVHSRNSNR